MPKRLMMTIVCFHICAVLAVVGMPLIVFGMWFSGQGAPIWALAAVPLGCVSMALAAELVVRGLMQRQHRAWVAGIALCCVVIVLYSAFVGSGLILGGLALWGLLDPESAAAFRPKPADAAGPPAES